MSQSYGPLYQMENGKRQENKGSWRYQSCDCCPYGYHIDLDFVRYCESVKERADYTSTMNKRRERRRQRQSMEVLLGLATPTQLNQPTERPANTPLPTVSVESRTPLTCEPAHSKSTTTPAYLQTALVQDALGDVVIDFERTLQRSTNGTLNTNDTFDSNTENLYRASSNSSVSSGSGCGWLSGPVTTTAGATFNGVDVEPAASSASSIALKNIRKQMALGLERMKELEEQVKIIPALQVQISVLKDEKRHLLELIKEQSTNVLSNGVQKTVVVRRDAAIMCGVITRNVGVGSQYPKTRHASTDTIPLENKADTEPVLICRPTQTEQIHYKETEMQTSQPLKYVCNVHVTAKPVTCDSALQISSPLRTIGVSNDSIKDTFCDRCNALTRTIGVGPSIDSEIPISLKFLSVPRSRSFNLGEEKLGHTSKNRTIGCQTEHFTMNRACQYEIKVSSRHCQYEQIGVISKGIQHENTGVSQLTDTLDLHVKTKDMGCNTVRVSTSDTASSTMQTIHSPEECDKKEESVGLISRIPRPSNPVSSPSERVKFRRQDTYTKIPTATTLNIGLSGIDLSPVDLDTVESESTSSFTPTKQNYNKTEVNSAIIKSPESYEVYSSGNKHAQPNTSLAVPESVLLNQIERSLRPKAVPSKEMQAALKVLNDYLHKSKSIGSNVINTKYQVKNALNIIQQEWFRISSLVNADPLNVEDYLDRFEEMSGTLLQYIVNMTDDSGNTAMHYAVSHGNFDVVSILLDSKVCNINKPNKAGYTSVMLVSLTEVRSSTDATVVRRLFQMADVNVRAKQHGQTALMLAVSHGRLDMVQMLLEAGADINIQDEDGSTALMCAAEHGHIEIVKYFLSQSECDSTIVDVDGSTALKIALEAGHKDIGVLLYAHEHSVHGVSPYSSLRQRKSKAGSGTSTTSVSRSPSRNTLDNKTTK